MGRCAQAETLGCWREYGRARRARARRQRAACSLALRQAQRKLHTKFLMWRHAAAAAAHARAHGVTALQRGARVRVRRWVAGWRLAAARQARGAAEGARADAAETLTQTLAEKAAAVGALQAAAARRLELELQQDAMQRRLAGALEAAGRGAQAEQELEALQAASQVVYAIPNLVSVI